MKEQESNSRPAKKVLNHFYLDREAALQLQELSLIYSHSKSEIVEVSINFLYSNYHSPAISEAKIG